MGALHRVLGKGLSLAPSPAAPLPAPRRRSASRPAPPRVTSAPPPLRVPLSLPESCFLLPRGRDPERPKPVPQPPAPPVSAAGPGLGARAGGWAGLQGPGCGE